MGRRENPRWCGLGRASRRSTGPHPYVGPPSVFRRPVRALGARGESPDSRVRSIRVIGIYLPPCSAQSGNIAGMERVLLAAAAVAVAVAAAQVVQRRRPAPPTQGAWTAPAQLDRADFDRPEAPWLLVVFTSATCDSCAAARDKAAVLASTEVAVQEVEHVARRDLHDRYNVEAVPMILLADAEGVVRKSFVGPPGVTDLWAAVAEVRATQQ